MAIITANLSRVQSGTTYEGASFTITRNSTPLDLTGAKIEMSISNQIWSVANGRLAITDAVNGVFQIKKQIITLGANSYNYSIKITFANGDVKKYIKGTWIIE